GAAPRSPAWPCGSPDCRAAALAAPLSNRHRSERKPGVARYHDPASPSALPPAALSVPLGLSQSILQHDVVEHRICQQTPLPAVLVFERAQPLGIGHAHAAIRGL